MIEITHEIDSFHDHGISEAKDFLYSSLFSFVITLYHHDLHTVSCS